MNKRISEKLRPRLLKEQEMSEEVEKSRKMRKENNR